MNLSKNGNLNTGSINRQLYHDSIEEGQNLILNNSKKQKKGCR